MFKSDEELFEEAERHLMGEAVRLTEQEIFDDTFNIVRDDDDDLDDLSAMEGFDGQPLSWDDMIEGPNENGYDRPASLRADEQLMAENQQLRDAYGDLAGRVDQIVNGPERREAMQAQLRDNLYQRYGVHALSADGMDRLVGDLTQADAIAQAATTDRINRSMGDAHREYGSDFEEAFTSFTHMDPRNPTAQALVRDIMNAQDPGERLMALHSNGMNAGLYPGGRGSRGSSDAFTEQYGLMGGRSAPSRGGGRRDLSDQDGGFGSRDVEEEIFWSAFN